MKSHTEYLTFNIPARLGFENITPRVAAAVTKSGVKEGLVLVNAMHITSVFVARREQAAQDYASVRAGAVRRVVERYAHNRTGENATPA